MSFFISSITVLKGISNHYATDLQLLCLHLPPMPEYSRLRLCLQISNLYGNLLSLLF